MKKIILGFLFLQSFVGDCQNLEKSKTLQYQIVYKTIHKPDTNNREYVKQEYMVLQFNNNISKYYSYENYLQKVEYKKSIDNGFEPNKSKIFNKIEYYNNYSEHHFVIIDQIVLDKYQTNYFKDKINWEIINESKILLGLKCQKAKASFKGRLYIAWFTQEIPLPIGPWKFQGLPGLVIEVIDEKNEVSFVASEINKVENLNLSIELNDQKKEISYYDYLNLKKAYQENPIKFIEQEIGGTISTSVTPKPRKKINNPIEKTD